jgi:hypothetical protein
MPHIRADIGSEHLLRALVGMCYLDDQPGWQAVLAPAGSV